MVGDGLGGEKKKSNGGVQKMVLQYLKKMKMLNVDGEYIEKNYLNVNNEGKIVKKRSTI